MALLLEVQDLTTEFVSPGKGWVSAIDGVNLKIDYGESLGLVGESGCGKSVTALSIMGLIPAPQGRIAHGRVLYEGVDLVTKSNAEMRQLRGKDLAMIFQQPMTSLNPVYTIGFQLTEALKAHEHVGPKEAEERAMEALSRVGIPDPKNRMRSFPHQFSGGMRQRVMIAMALLCNPKILIADEPTTALDVTIQAQILDLMRSLRKGFNSAVLLITHDLGVVAEMCTRVIIMYAGQVVEEGNVRDIFGSPLHPYTRGLLESVPRMTAEKRKLHVIKGLVPSIGNYPPGCRFAPRCDRAEAGCSRPPNLVSVGGGRMVRCWHPILEGLAGGVRYWQPN